MKVKGNVMIIESGERLELEVIEGAKKLVRIYIDETNGIDESIKYRYKQLVFSVNDSLDLIENRTNKVKTTLYTELRESEYPPMADYLDAIVKGDVEAEEAYKAKCLAVKAKYPKANV